jgi:hypothetical protein
MKLALILIFTVTTILSGCETFVTKAKNNPNELIYSAADTSAGALSVATTLSGDIAHQQLTTQIKLVNSESTAIDIQEIDIETPEGIRSQPQTGSVSFSLKPGKDTSLSLNFHPLNDLILYQTTGLQGDFKPAYTTLITYKTAAGESPASLALRSKAEKGAYQDYTKAHKKILTGYSFNTKTSFNETEKKYLSSLKQAAQPPFVYLTEQEIAICGLNFRLKCYDKDDTLHAELFVVNHSEFPVKVIPDELDIVGGETHPGGSKAVSLEKISGRQQDQTMMEKGDRVLIHFKKYFKTKIAAAERPVFHIRNAFMLSGKKPLFNQDVELLPIQF